MSNVARISLCLLCIAWIAGNSGCGPKKSSPTAPKAVEGPALAPPQQPAAQPTEGEPGGKTSDAAAPSANEEVAEVARIKASLASLTAEDRALAEKQQICPVSGEPLGAMGAPKKISVAGHEVFICCEGCEKSLIDEPAKYLAKIGLQPTQ